MYLLLPYPRIFCPWVVQKVNTKMHSICTAGTDIQICLACTFSQIWLMKLKRCYIWLLFISNTIWAAWAASWEGWMVSCHVGPSLRSATFHPHMQEHTLSFHTLGFITRNTDSTKYIFIKGKPLRNRKHISYFSVTNSITRHRKSLTTAECLLLQAYELSLIFQETQKNLE